MTHPLADLIRPPRHRRVVLSAVGVVLVAGIAWYLGLDTWNAIELGGVLLALVILWILPPRGEHADRAVSSQAVPQGYRRDVAELSRSLHARTGRVRGVAAQRLATQKLNLDDPADRAGIERLIGAGTYSTLLPDAQRLPTLRALLHCLDMLDRLDRQHRTKEKP